MSVADELLEYLEAAYIHDTPLKLETLNELLAKAPRLASYSTYAMSLNYMENL